MKIAFTSLALAIIIIISLYWVFQRKLIYMPDKHRPTREACTASDMDEVTLNTKDGLKLYAWYKKPQSKKTTIIYFHGNGGHLCGRMPLVRQFLNNGFGVLLLSYRGYAGNPGSPSEKGLYQDGRAAMDFVRRKDHCAVVLGESLGTGVATQMATEYPVKGLILQSPFLSLVAMAKLHYPWLFIEPVDKFHSDKKIAKVKAPLLVIHGEADTIVPYSQGKALYDMAQSKKQLLSYPGRGHADLWDAGFYTKIVSFLDGLDKTCHVGSPH